MSCTTARGRAGSALAAVVLVAAIAACGEPDARVAPDPAESVIETATLRPGEDLPIPVDPAVLTVTGRIASTNGEQSLRLDPANLQRLGLRKVTVFEPWVKQQMDFQGFWLADLLAAAKADETAASLHVTALDNYQVDLTMADVRAGGIFLATRTGAGAPLSVDDGGPTRIVFVGDIPSGASPDQWIWSLTTIDVR